MVLYIYILFSTNFQTDSGVNIREKINFEIKIILVLTYNKWQ